MLKCCMVTVTFLLAPPCLVNFVNRELDGDERIRAPARRWRARRRVDTSPYPSLPFRTPRYCLAPHILSKLSVDR